MDDQLKNIINSEDSNALMSFIVKNKSKLNLNKVDSSPKPIKKIPETREHKPNITSTYVDYSKIHGYGVFAFESIEKDDVIETCYTIELEFRDKYHKDTIILDYAYAASSKDNETKKHGNRLFMLTGNGMLYNHSKNHNAYWKLLSKTNQAILIANQTIKPKSEITIDYGPDYWTRKNVSKN